MPTGMFLPSFGSAMSEHCRGASQANYALKLTSAPGALAPVRLRSCVRAGASAAALCPVDVVPARSQLNAVR